MSVRSGSWCSLSFASGFVDFWSSFVRLSVVGKWEVDGCCGVCWSASVDVLGWRWVWVVVCGCWCAVDVGLECDAVDVVFGGGYGVDADWCFAVSVWSVAACGLGCVCVGAVGVCWLYGVE